MEWTKLTDHMPNPDEHDRVLIYTEGYDFAGEQFFDVKAETLNKCMYEDPEDQPEVCRLASHWCPRPTFVTPCDICQHRIVEEAILTGGHWKTCVLTCALGHKPRFFKPKNAVDYEWGWKRRCADHKERANAD